MRAKAIYDVILLSAFGRMEPFAIELTQRGMDVALVDVSDHFSRTSWRDVSGPFPAVTPSPSLPAHLDWLRGDAFKELEFGLPVWLRSGPLGLGGPLSSFYAEEHLSVGLLKDYLARRIQNSKSSSIFSKLYKDLSFSENWMIHLSHALTQNRMTLHCDSAGKGNPFPLNQSQQLVKIEKAHLADLKNAAINAGVDFFEKNQLSQIHSTGKRIESLEFKDSFKLNGHFYVWGLNQEESYHLNKEVFAKSFSSAQPVLSDWVWRRMELRSKQDLFNSMPDSFLMIQNFEWSWTNENFVIFKRENGEQWDLWFRVPREGMEEKFLIGEISRELRERLGSFEGEFSWPNPPDVFSFPVYETKKIKSLPEIRFKNVIFEGREKDKRLDLASRFEHQVEWITELEAWKQKLEKQLLKKGGVIDRSVHPS